MSRSVWVIEVRRDEGWKPYHAELDEHGAWDYYESLLGEDVLGAFSNGKSRVVRYGPGPDEPRVLEGDGAEARAGFCKAIEMLEHNARLWSARAEESKDASTRACYQRESFLFRDSSEYLREELERMTEESFSFSRDIEAMVGRALRRSWVERVVRGLGCECPDELFEVIRRRDLSNEGFEETLEIGARLLVAFVSSIRIYEGARILERGVWRRNEEGLNRFRLVFVGRPPAGEIEKLQRIAALHDDRAHVHVLAGAELRALMGEVSDDAR